jgi:hypothetical protein
MASSNSSDRALTAQIAAHARWGEVEDRAAATAPARRAFEARFKNENQRKAYFLRLALASAQARRARKASGS